MCDESESGHNLIFFLSFVVNPVFVASPIVLLLDFLKLE